MTDTKRLTKEEMRRRVLDAFQIQQPDEPYWFIGIYPTKEGDPDDADLIVRFDIGEYPLVLCAKNEDMNRLIRQDTAENSYLVVGCTYTVDTIRKKALHFFEREYRVRKKHAVARPRQKGVRT
ncbi:MAG: hypothetical protein JWL82_78 [Parcubacteria group bacterium]|nr:hypothetical protein [Parcubacteria group bacterium]